VRLLLPKLLLVISSFCPANKQTFYIWTWSCTPCYTIWWFLPRLSSHAKCVFISNLKQEKNKAQMEL